jgi:multidrug resistance protein, MATE family
VIFSLCRSCLAGFFSGVGRTRIVMIASCTAMLVNVVVNYVLIFGKLGFPELGIRGAAYGTIIGGASSVLLLAAAYFGRRNRVEFSIVKALRFDKTVFTKLLRFGSPTGLEMFLNLLAFDAVVLAFQAYSPVAATAATIVFNWDMVSFVPLIGVEIGVMSLVGRFMGARKPEIAHMSVMSGLKMGTIYSAAIFILFAVFPQNLVNIFCPSAPDPVFAAAMPTAVFMVRMAALYVLVEAVLIVFIGALRGAGDTFWAMAMSVTTHWIMFAIAIISFRVLKVSPETAWLFMIALFLAFSLVVYLRYRHGAWKKIKVIHEAEPVMLGDGFHETGDL